MICLEMYQQHKQQGTYGKHKDAESQPFVAFAGANIYDRHDITIDLYWLAVK